MLSCVHCGESHPADWSHCPRTGKALGTGKALLGRTIAGRYRIVGVLGEGGMGAVYAAEHLMLGRRVAVKRLHPELASDEQAVARFQREARAAAATGHEHIVEILDMGFAEDGAPFLVMEYLTGESLAQVLKREKRLAASRACYVVGQILAGLEAVHDKGIVHRDLKPDNVFLTRKQGRNDYVKLLDFGVSKMRAPDGGESNPLTRTGVMMGTPHYMSPEQASGTRSLDHRVDLYAVGVILYECLAGVVPFDGPNYHALLQSILLARPRPLDTLVQGLPPGLAHIVHKSMSKDTSERYPNAREMLRSLVPFGAVEEQRAGGSAPPPVAPVLAPPAHEPSSPPTPRTQPASSFQIHDTPTLPADVMAVVAAREAARFGSSPSLSKGGAPQPSVSVLESAPRPRVLGPPRHFSAVSADWQPEVARRSRPRGLSANVAESTPPLEPSPPRSSIPDARASLAEGRPITGPTPLPQVRGTLVMAALDHLKSTYGERELERMKKRMPMETADRLSGVILPVAWLPQEMFDDLVLAAEAEFGTGNGDVARAIGRAYATRDVPTTYRLLLLGATPTMTVQRFPALWQASHDTGSLVLSPLEGGGFAIEIRDFVADAFLHVDAMAGFFARVVEFAGARDVRSDVVAARGRTSDRTTIHIRWR